MKTSGIMRNHFSSKKKMNDYDKEPSIEILTENKKHPTAYPINPKHTDVRIVIAPKYWDGGVTGGYPTQMTLSPSINQNGKSVFSKFDVISGFNTIIIERALANVCFEHVDVQTKH
eukprot:430217_1